MGWGGVGRCQRRGEINTEIDKVPVFRHTCDPLFPSPRTSPTAANPYDADTDGAHRRAPPAHVCRFKRLPLLSVCSPHEALTSFV